MLAQIILNSQPTGATAFVLQQGGKLYLASQNLAGLNFRIPDSVALIHYQDNSFTGLASIPGLKASISASHEFLYMSCDALCFNPNRLTAGHSTQPAITDDTGGLILDYDIVAEEGENRKGSIRSLANVRYASSMGRLYTDFVATAYDGHEDLLRLESGISIDIPESRKRTILGDTISRASDWSVPVRYAGIKFGTDFSLQPGFIAFPTPALSGSAGLPSTVDVYINDLRRFNGQIPAGPFSIENIPFISGQGDARIVVTDILGRQTILTEQFYAAPVMLRKGLTDYSIELGVLRNSYGQRSFDYGDEFASATWRSGISEGITLESHGAITQTHQSVGMGGIFMVGLSGTVSTAIAISQKDGDIGLLGRTAVDVSRRTWRGNITVEATTPHFFQLGQPENMSAPAWRVQARVGFPFMEHVRPSLIYTYSDQRKDADLETFSANINMDVWKNVSLSISAIQTVQPEQYTTIGLSLNVPLGNGMSAGAGARRSRDRITGSAYVQRSPSQGKFGYKASVTEGDFERYEASLMFRPEFARLQLDASHTNRDNAARISARGSLVIHEGEPYLAQKIDNGYAVVSLPDGMDATVYLDNRPIGTTGKDGKFLVPGLRAFENNKIEVDIRELSLQETVSDLRWNIVPARSAGSTLSAKPRLSKGYLIRLVDENGDALALGTRLQIMSHPPANKNETVFVVGHDGRSYINVHGEHRRISLQASKGEKSCRTTLDVKNLPSLAQEPETLVCIAG